MKITKPVPSTPSEVFLGLPQIVRPAYSATIRFPADVTQLDAQNVSELLGKYSELSAYAVAKKAEYDVEDLRLCHMEDVETARLMTERPGLNNQERWKRDSVVSSYPSIQRIRVLKLSAQQGRRTAEAYCLGYEKLAAALSRELSRKTTVGDTATTPFGSRARRYQ